MFEGHVWIIPILLASVIVFGLSIMLSIRANGSFFRPTACVWFMWWLFVYILFGATYLMVVEDPYEVYVGLYNYPDAIMGAWELSLAAALLIPFGMNIANFFWKSKPQKLWIEFCEGFRGVCFDELSNSFHLFFSIITFITIIVSALYYIQIDVPLAGVIQGLDAKEIALARSDATGNFSGKYYRYALFKDKILNLLVLISFFLRRHGAYRYVFIGLFLLRAIICLADTQKAPIIELLILLMLAAFYEKKKISKKILLSIGGVIVGIIVIMYVFFMGMNLFSENFFLDILRRVFVAQGVGVSWSLVYVECYGYLCGATLPNPAELLPFTHIRYPVELMKMVFPHIFERGGIGSMPTVFYGEIYANFGVVIAVVSMIMMGMVLRTIDIFCQYYSKTNSWLYMTLYVFLIDWFKRYSGHSILGVFIEESLYVPVIIIFIFVYVNSEKWRSKECGTINCFAKIFKK